MNTTLNCPEHLQPYAWRYAHQTLIYKMISELAHESVIEPAGAGSGGSWQTYTLTAPGNAKIEYRFLAQKRSLNHWHIREGSLSKWSDNLQTELDAVRFILEFKNDLGIKKESLPDYLEEIICTLYSFAFIRAKEALPSDQLIHENFQAIEHAMSKGHPSFIANNGRVGFDADDYIRYSPEADQKIRLVWIAGHQSKAGYSAIEELPYKTLLSRELGEATMARFDAVLRQKNLNPADYVYMPVHPWQWRNKIALLFADDIASQKLVPLGYTSDEYSAQQSLRTLYNLSHPEKFYVKTSLSILNMGFVRGMSPYFMDSTPSVTSWIKKLLEDDPYIRATGFTMIREVAAVGFRHSYFEEFGTVFPHNKMLAALWRESPASVLSPGQQVMTMAALLHVDHQREAFIKHLILASGLSPEDWLSRYLQRYLSPLLHCFYAYDLTFMPHGENVLLVLENHQPVRIIIKDISEEICVFGEYYDMPEKARRVCTHVPDEIRVLNILVDIMDGYFRFLSEILSEHCQLPEHEFWRLVAENIQRYQDAHPQYEEKYRRFDLFADEFKRSCLNRLQLRDHKQMVNTGDADALTGLQYVGTLKNPLAAFREKRHTSATQTVQDFQTL